MQPATGRRYRDGLAPDAPALGADWGEVSGRRWAMDRRDGGKPGDPLLFELLRQHGRMHDGRPVGEEERRRIAGVLLRPQMPAPAVPMVERQPDDAPARSTAGGPIAALVPADPVRRYVPQHRRGAAVVIAPAQPQESRERSIYAPLPAALPSGRCGRPGRPPPPAGAPVVVSEAAGKRPIPSVSPAPLAAAGEQQRDTPGVTAGRDPHPLSPERAAKSGAGPDAREAAADATCKAVTAGRDRHFLSEPMPGTGAAPAPLPRLSLALIRAMAAAHYGVPVAVIVSPSRTVAVVRARQAAMWLCRQLTAASLPQIGAAFGGRDHTTVIHAVMVVDALRARDEDFADDLDALAGRIRQSSSPRGRR